MRLVDLFREDKDVLSVLLRFLNYHDYKTLSSVDRECARSPLRAQVFRHSRVRLPFPRIVADHVDWAHYHRHTFLRGVTPAMLEHISSVSIPHSELALALGALPFLDTVCIWSVPKQALRDASKPHKKRQHQQRRRDQDEARRATREMCVRDFAALTMLSELHLHRSDVLDLAAIGELTNLTSLDMANTRLENANDYRHLGALPQLEKLNLCDARLRNASFLRKLTQLKWLDLEGTKISTLSDMTQLTQLEHLNVGDVWVESGVISLPQLTKLRVFLASYIASFTPITIVLEAPELQKCDLRGAMVVDLAFLAHSPQLRSLDIRETRLVDLDVLRHVPLLKKLVLTAQPQALRAIPWDALPHLEDLHVEKWFAAPAEYEVIDGAFFSSLPSLSALHIEQLSDFSWIAMPGSSLRRLMIKNVAEVDDEERLVELSDTPIEVLHLRVQHRAPPALGIQAFSNSLVELRLVDAVADDFSWLQSCTKLEMLDLSVRETATWRPLPRQGDFTFLKALTKLRVLWLTGRHDFKDVSILTALPKLEILRLDKTRITDAAPLAQLTTLKQLALDGSKITELPDLHRLTSLEAIGLPLKMDCSAFHVVGAFPALFEIWHEEGYNCFWTGHGVDVTASTSDGASSIAT